MTTSIHKSLADEILGSLGEPTVTDAPESKETATMWPEVTEELSSNQQWFSELFGWKPELFPDFGVDTFKGYDTPDRVNYIWPKPETEMFVRAMQNGQKTRIIGHSGSGKTAMCEQVAAVTGRPCVVISFNAFLEPADVIGEVRLEGGSTKFLDGPLVRAMKEPTLIIFDEYTAASAAMSMSLQRFTDVGELFVTGRLSDDGADVIQKHPKAILCAADNTRGLGDDLDKYAARNVQDTSTLNRWDICVPLDYQSEDTELEFIKSEQPELPEDIAKKISKVSALFHAGFISGDLAVPFSMRNLRTIALTTMQLRDPIAAIEWNYTNTLDTDSKAAARELIRTVFGK